MANTQPMASFARRSTRVVLGIAVLLAVLTPLAFWLRTSSLVAVERVAVTGIDGPQAKTIEAALTNAALDMTVLQVREDALRDAVEPFPVVRSLRTETDFPHGLRITVNAYEPVGALEAGGRLTAVAADGTLLRGISIRGLPLVGVRTTPGGRRVDDRKTLGAVGVLAAAPPALRARVDRVYRGPRGLAATMQDGPKLYFGGASQLAAKWGAAAQVLSHSGSRGARHVDLRVPQRPVAGGLKPRIDNTQPQL